METALPRFDSVFSTDCVIFGFETNELKVLLIDRNEEPFKGSRALPGYIVKNDESIDDAAERILYELTGLRNLHMEQFHTFGDVDRHPQGRVITVAYYALIRIDSQQELKPISNFARAAYWYPVKELGKLPFDHRKVFETGFQKIRRRLSYQPIAFELLPEKFTLTQLQILYEAILDKKL
ncbi:MAG: NUDIX domain-containing protein, partial [Sphingobacteriaceae bacterium]